MVALGRNIRGLRDQICDNMVVHGRKHRAVDALSLPCWHSRRACIGSGVFAKRNGYRPRSRRLNDITVFPVDVVTIPSGIGNSEFLDGSVHSDDSTDLAS